MSKPAEKARDIEVLVLDVDGVLSNGLLIYSDNGEETKTFHPADGLGIKLLQSQGIAVAIITGRLSRIVERRAAEQEGVRLEDAEGFALRHVPAGSVLHEAPKRNVSFGATDVVFAHESFEPMGDNAMPVKAVTWDENCGP